ncbi:putative acyltransferase [Saccharomonospora marina XMU15]|uniref:Putative acyltransferase n=1 Tax=Saccharomonospora marina XMU15 TaxID=882083 RepID=H5X7M4_9PSEU|nr:acyltransferase family protein [Saccharomonospora marina]EHR51316.1 putative acyltransferase [Saccharomonospora marina XMU15]
MSVLRASVPEGLATSSRPQRRYRPELQGLRALAAVLVVVYHVWLGRISGGVDVFFLISGFLITGQLFRAGLRGRIEFRPMWGRMIKRLFPAALTVLLATIALSVWLLPEHRWFQTIREVVASALYAENWVLAADSVNYFAQHSSASVVQHFWSLSIQGQFYLVWPLLVAGVAFFARRAGWSLRRSLFTVLGVLLAVSLAYSVWLTAVDQPLAYFTSLTRIWEFALGGLLALVIEAITVPGMLRVLLGWLGVFGLVSCGMLLQVGTVFPGYAALWPTVSAALVLVAGVTGYRVGADRFLSSRPLIYLGNLSYSLYLWHWPVLLFYLIWRDQPAVGWRGGAVVIAVSMVLAALTYHLVEQPVRDSRIGVSTNWGAYRFGVAALVPVLLVAGAWQLVSTQRASFALDVDDPDHPGAMAMEAGGPILDVRASVVPPFAALPHQYAPLPDEECVDSPRHEDLRVCTIEPEGPPTRRVVLTGDSHAHQYIAALRPIVRNRGWQVTTMLKGGCALIEGSKWPECASWNDAVLAEILQRRPEAVITMGTRDVRVGLRERTPRGYVAQWRVLAEAGIPVVAIRDNPRFDYEPSECVQKHGIDAWQCRKPRADMLAEQPPYERMSGIPATVSFLDFSDYFCTDRHCPPVIGNMLVYLDDNHVTAAYLETMSPIVEERMVAALGWENDPLPAASR